MPYRNILSTTIACLITLADFTGLGQNIVRISINDGWRFMRYTGEPDTLIYDARQMVMAVTTSSTHALKAWIHQRLPGKMIVSSETVSALSARGTYIFPVTDGTSGWDYLGEPTPYYSARSSYSGVIDLAGFKKDRFYLYQSRWRPDHPMAHIIPHWTWPDRVGKITPVHVFTIKTDGEDLAFVTVRVVDGHGVLVPRADNDIIFEVDGPGEIVATDNGDPTDLRSFASKERKAFNGMALAIVRAKKGKPGVIRISARSKELREGQVVINAK